MDGIVAFTIPVPIASPCIHVCRIDPANARCEGCRRTLDEIVRWTTMPPAERDRIMTELADR